MNPDHKEQLKDIAEKAWADADFELALDAMLGGGLKRGEILQRRTALLEVQKRVVEYRQRRKKIFETFDISGYDSYIANELARTLAEDCADWICSLLRWDRKNSNIWSGTNRSWGDKVVLDNIDWTAVAVKYAKAAREIEGEISLERKIAKIADADNLRTEEHPEPQQGASTYTIASRPRRQEGGRCED